MLQLELARNHAELGKMMDAEVPAGWPPPLYEDGAIRWVLQRLQGSQRTALWYTWYFIRRDPGGRRELIGAGGFKGAPRGGAVEIGYSVVPSAQGLGLATEAAAGLVAWARTFPGVRKIVAHTLPELGASIRVLEKNGFKQRGKPDEPEAIRFELDLRRYNPRL